MVSDYPKVTFRKHTFLSALALGVSAIVIALITCCTVVIIYGMHFVGEKSEQIVSLVEDAVQGLPTVQKSLPPIFSDILDDRRQPDYSSQLEITAKTAVQSGHSGRVRASVTVVNKGQEVVTLLSLRVLVLDGAGEIVGVSSEWAATPFTVDDNWRGPILPGAHRYFTCVHDGPGVLATDDLKAVVEITDVRVWSGARDDSATETPEPSEIESQRADVANR